MTVCLADDRLDMGRAKEVRWEIISVVVVVDVDAGCFSRFQEMYR